MCFTKLAATDISKAAQGGLLHLTIWHWWQAMLLVMEAERLSNCWRRVLSDTAVMRKLNDDGSWPLAGQSFEKVDKRWHSDYEIPGVTGLSRSCCCQNCRECLMLLVSMEVWILKCSRSRVGREGGWKCSYWSVWTLHSSVLPMRCNFSLNTTHDLHKGHPSQHALAHFSSRHRRGRIFRCVCVNVHLLACLCPPANVSECV